MAMPERNRHVIMLHYSGHWMIFVRRCDAIVRGRFRDSPGICPLIIGPSERKLFRMNIKSRSDWSGALLNKILGSTLNLYPLSGHCDGGCCNNSSRFEEISLGLHRIDWNRHIMTHASLWDIPFSLNAMKIIVLDWIVSTDDCIFRSAAGKCP